MDDLVFFIKVDKTYFLNLWMSKKKSVNAPIKTNVAVPRIIRDDGRGINNNGSCSSLGGVGTKSIVHKPYAQSSKEHGECDVDGFLPSVSSSNDDKCTFTGGRGDMSIMAAATLSYDRKYHRVNTDSLANTHTVPVPVSSRNNTHSRDTDVQPHAADRLPDGIAPNAPGDTETTIIVSNPHTIHAEAPSVISRDTTHIREDPLTVSMMESFEKNKTGDAKRDLLCVVKAMEITMNGLGVKSNRIFAGGSIDEFLLANQIGGVVNTSMQGVDITLADGTHVESKSSRAGLGEKTNVNIVLPVKRPKESQEAWYVRMEADILKKGNLKISQHYDGDHCNEYIIGADFLVFYARTKECFGSSKLNIGAVSCTVCTKVHRLVKLMEYEKQWRNNPAASTDWKLLFNSSITQTCSKKKQTKGEVEDGYEIVE